MTCSTCDDYRFVEVEGQHEKVPCTDCWVDEEVRRCPEHGVRLVSGRCPRCNRAADVATELLHEAAALRHRPFTRLHQV